MVTAEQILSGELVRQQRFMTHDPETCWWCLNAPPAIFGYIGDLPEPQHPILLKDWIAANLTVSK